MNNLKNLKKEKIFLMVALCFCGGISTNAQIVIPSSPKMEVETSKPGQVALRAHSGPIGAIVLPPTDAGSIGVVATGFSGVKGTALAEQGHGIWGHSVKKNANGVYGFASGQFGEGVEGRASGSQGKGVYGRYEGTTGYGVHGVGIGSNVRGIFGTLANGSTGHCGYFTGGTGVYVWPKLGVRNLAPQYPIHLGEGNLNGNGAHVTGGGTWTNGSSRSFKHDFESIDKQDILTKLCKLDITEWAYKSVDEGKHIGPMAEDFYEVFGLGHDKKYITTTDADGVVIAAVQGLYDLVRNQDKKIEQLKIQLQENRNQMTLKETGRAFKKRKKRKQ